MQPIRSASTWQHIIQEFVRRTGMVQSKPWAKSPLVWLLLFTLLHGIWYSLIILPWQGRDELQNYVYLEQMVTQRVLVPDFDGGSFRIEGELLESLETFQYYRYQRLSTPDRGTPLEIPIENQRPLGFLLSLPFYAMGLLGGPLARLYLLRLFSVLLLVLTVWITYSLAKLAFISPRSDWLTIFPAMAVALLPQVSSSLAAFSTFALALPLTTCAFCFILRGYRADARPIDLVIATVIGVVALSASRYALIVTPILIFASLAYAWHWSRTETQILQFTGAAVWAAFAMALVIVITYMLEPLTIPGPLMDLIGVTPEELQQFDRAISGSVLMELDWGDFLSSLSAAYWGFSISSLTLPPALLQDTLMILSVVLVSGLLGGLARRLQAGAEDERVLSPFAGILLTAVFGFTFILVLSSHLLEPGQLGAHSGRLLTITPPMAVLFTWSWISFWPQRLQSTSLQVATVMLVFYDIYVWAYVMVPGWYS